MEDTELLSYSVVFCSLWLVYGLKWAILVSFTIIVIVYTLRNYKIGTFRRERQRKGEKFMSIFKNHGPLSQNQNEDFVDCVSNERGFSGEESL